ncbi:hypothetical protein FVE89_15135 [Methylobacterium sp. 2A]|jgi:hypothetical protein|uniref:hypothetical protein n=1 Tax=Methylobacterium sp. 2A TaxID=2603816 RepID=UPI001353FADE|nr:hypothetical protein [Methylobacterium sp. 2A]MWV23303.1 hypothetical protein [Methylobacterium sp. 2A]
MQQIDTPFLQAGPVETGIERLGPVAAANLRAPAVDPFEAFVAPGDVFRHPREVLTYPGLSTPEKRAILASWASDARAIESSPTLRCLPGCRAEPVPIDEILAALQALDAGSAPEPSLSRPLFPAAFTRRWDRGRGAPGSALN